MGRYRQYSYVLKSPEKGQGKEIEIVANKFVQPEKFLSIVNQYGEPKIHAIVDTESDLKKYKLLVIGTGQSIPEEYIDCLIKIGSLVFSDGQYGYHYYLVDDNFNGDFYKKIVIKSRDGSDSDEFDDLKEDILLFVNAHPDYLDTILSFDHDEDSVITVVMKNKSAEFEKTEEFKDFITVLCNIEVADVSIEVA